jgi:hypothetical protein
MLWPLAGSGWPEAAAGDAVAHEEEADFGFGVGGEGGGEAEGVVGAFGGGGFVDDDEAGHGRASIWAMTAEVNSSVVAEPPRSRVRCVLSRKTVIRAFWKRSAAADSPR